MVNEVETTIKNQERLWRIHHRHVGYLDVLASFTWNPLTSVAWALSLQGSFARREEQSHTTCLHPVVESSQIRRLRAASREAITTNLVAINVLTTEQIVDGAAVVEKLLCGKAAAKEDEARSNECMLGSYTTGKILALCVDGLLTLTLRERVDHHGSNTIDSQLLSTSRPRALSVESMSAHLDTGRNLALRLLGQIKMGCDVTAWRTLKDNLLDYKAVALQRAYYLGIEFATLWHFASQLTKTTTQLAHVLLHGFLRLASLFESLLALIVLSVYWQHLVVVERGGCLELQSLVRALSHCHRTCKHGGNR